MRRNKRVSNSDLLCTPYEPETPSGHSRNRDYSIQYGRNCRMNESDHDEPTLSRKESREQGLTMRHEL